MIRLLKFNPYIWDSDNKEAKDPQTQPTITNKEVTFALETFRKYIVDNEGMENLFKPLGCLENIIENNVLNKQKQLTLHQFFKNDNM